ncbi:unnamed protein product [Paramecium octaurelia]|uniref:Uncharacterized protein n=1 Tax=Paramecium octaurelia TaxID=43137 RepID=A0A8S1YLF2_PAROT|nr:unnamed protein product [Paramecium octaurelia]
MVVGGKELFTLLETKPLQNHIISVCFQLILLDYIVACNDNLNRQQPPKQVSQIKPCYTKHSFINELARIYHFQIDETKYFLKDKYNHLCYYSTTQSNNKEKKKWSYLRGLLY